MENLEETRPENMDQRDKKKGGDGNELSAVEQHIKTISKTVRKRTKEEIKLGKERVGSYMTQLTQEEGIDDERELAKRERKYLKEARKVDAVNCLFNPKSFTQTVENIFHFSFTVKEGKAEIKSRGYKEAEKYGLEPGPVVASIDGEDKPLPKQAIVSLSMKVSYILLSRVAMYHPSSDSNFVFKSDVTLFCRTGRTCVLPTQLKRVMFLTEKQKHQPRRGHANLTK